MGREGDSNRETKPALDSLTKPDRDVLGYQFIRNNQWPVHLLHRRRQSPKGKTNGQNTQATTKTPSQTAAA